MASRNRHSGNSNNKKTKKRTKKQLIAAIITVIIVIFMIVGMLVPLLTYAQELDTAPPVSYTVVIEDEAGLLVDSDRQELQEIMDNCSLRANVACVTILQNDYYDTQKFAEAFNEMHFNSNGIVFVIDMQNRYLYLDSTGEAREYITMANANTITDNVYRYASEGDYGQCAVQVFEQVYNLMRGMKISRPMKYTSNALLAVVLGFLTCFIFARKGAKMKAANVRDLLEATNSKVELSPVETVFINQTKVYDPPSSSSGGGGGGGHSGGGGGGHSGGGHGF